MNTRVRLKELSESFRKNIVGACEFGKRFNKASKI